MSIFSSQKNKTEEKIEKTKDLKLAVTDAKSGILHQHASGVVIIRPRITEKASLKAESENVYVFEVSDKANKNTIKRAVHDLYKVHPTKVRITRISSKQVFVRGKWGVKSGGKKAYVYVKKGDKIEII